jgi:hypothetical protein
VNVIEAHYICMKIAWWNPLKLLKRRGRG